MLYFDYLHQKISRKYPNTFKINKSKCFVYNKLNFNIHVGPTCIINISYDSPLEILKKNIKRSRSLFQRLNTGCPIEKVTVSYSCNLKMIKTYM